MSIKRKILQKCAQKRYKLCRLPIKNIMLLPYFINNFFNHRCAKSALRRSKLRQFFIFFPKKYIIPYPLSIEKHKYYYCFPKISTVSKHFFQTITECTPECTKLHHYKNLLQEHTSKRHSSAWFYVPRNIPQARGIPTNPIL